MKKIRPFPLYQYISWANKWPRKKRGENRKEKKQIKSNGEKKRWLQNNAIWWWWVHTHSTRRGICRLVGVPPGREEEENGQFVMFFPPSIPYSIQEDSRLYSTPSIGEVMQKRSSGFFLFQENLVSRSQRVIKSNSSSATPRAHQLELAPQRRPCSTVFQHL